MDNLIKKYKEQLTALAKQEFPKEACGVFVQKGKTIEFIPCKNEHPHPTQDFECSIQIADIEDDDREIVAVFHSHTNGNTLLTDSDKTWMNSCKIPYLLFTLPQETFAYEYPTSEEIPLKGRFYVAGVQDCYTIVKDYYQRKHNISLKDFYRNDKWWDNGLDVLTEEHFKEAGFFSVSLEEIQEGDVVVMQFGRCNDHLAIYTGNSRILHHCYNRLSCEDIYGGMWLKHTTSIQRYRG